MLTLIGLGLNDERGISIQGLDRARNSDLVFAEFYTNPMPRLSMKKLETLVGKPIKILSRTDVEEKAEQSLLGLAERKNVVLLVPGDPMTATTHVDLRLRAAKRNIKTAVIHGVSVISAAAGSSGLQSYKFGRTVTIPIVESDPPVETPYDVIKENGSRGLHTLVLLDVKADLDKYILIGEALKQLLTVEQKRREHIVHESRLVVGIARIGADDMIVKGGRVADLIGYDFGGPPHSLIFPGQLHFVEVEALRVLAGTDQEILEAKA